MRNRALAIATIAAAITLPVAAQAQGYYRSYYPGYYSEDYDADAVVSAPPAVVDEDVGIAVDEVPAFRDYVIRERIPSYTIREPVVVGGILPETGVTYYGVPRRFGVVRYRYTVVNGAPVLVEPRTRRIIQVLD